MSQEGEPYFTRDDAIVQFTNKFPIDDQAKSRLQVLPDDQLQRVFNEFNPQQDSNPDYSRRLMGFLKFVGGGGPAPPGSMAGFGGGGTGAVNPAQYSGPIVSMEQLEMFKLNYPMDESAFDYLSKAPPDVQERVISTFNANCVQDDYSRMITAHIRFCMTKRDQPGQVTGKGGGGGCGFAQQANPNQPTVSVEAAYQAITGTVPLGSAAGGGELPQEALDQFRQQYPMDERAYDYLRTAPPDVQHRVVTTFKCDTPGQADFSRAVTGHVRFCLQQSRKASSDQMQIPAGMTVEQLLQAIADFQARYPVDERALQYLLQASGEAKRRTLTEFRSSGTVDGDYSKTVTAFVRRCMDEEKASGFGRPMGGGVFGSMGGGCGGGGGFGSMGGGGGSSVEQTARQLMELLGKQGGGGAGVQQAQMLVQAALLTASQGAEPASKRPRTGFSGGGGGW